MEDKFDNFFSETDFDFQEPHAGHKNRFERKLNQSKKTTKIKDNATIKINNIKDKFNKSDLKKKLLKFKNSKSHKEYKEN